MFIRLFHGAKMHVMKCLKVDRRIVDRGLQRLLRASSHYHRLSGQMGLESLLPLIGDSIVGSGIILVFTTIV